MMKFSVKNLGRGNLCGDEKNRSFCVRDCSGNPFFGLGGSAPPRQSQQKRLQRKARPESGNGARAQRARNDQVKDTPKPRLHSVQSFVFAECKNDWYFGIYFVYLCSLTKTWG